MLMIAFSFLPWCFCCFTTVMYLSAENRKDEVVWCVVLAVPVTELYRLIRKQR
jgi:hypothetical protein